jgi:hypothetical protein
MRWRDWMVRFTFSFFIVAFALFWHGQRQYAAGDKSWRSTAWMGAGIACVLMGVTALRLRHTPPTDPPR